MHSMKDTDAGNTMYVRLLVMAVLSFAAMYVLMYAMVNTLENVVHNVNQVYMAGLMTAPMVLIERAVMRGMYHDRRLSIFAGGASVLLLIASFVAIRQQTAVSDEQFLRSMVPHHAGAILMCQQAAIADPEIIELCRGITEGQQSEIDQMRAILTRLGQ